MTLKDKKNKREYQNKLKAQGGAKNNDDKTNNHKEKGKTVPKPQPEAAPPASNFQGVAENADKLITEANQRYLAAEAKDEEVDPKYAKRNITSNWTKYELPSSDDDEDEASQDMTGADFEYVMASAQGADSHFRLKSEKEWESHTESLGELSEEFFSLDLSELERSVSCIPLHQQICLAQEEFDKDMLERLIKKAEAATGGSLAASAEVEEVISQKILDILNIKKDDKPKELLTAELKQNLASTEVEVAKTEALEQRQPKRRIRGEASAEADPNKDNAVEEAPLAQRPNRRQRGTKADVSNQQTVSTVSAGEEEKDLKFFDNIEKDKTVKVDMETKAVSAPIVPVTIVGEDTKNLEDWLDDFLDD